MHETVGEVTRPYLDLVDEQLPGRIEGLYLVGSVALDDYRPGGSDVDFVAVSRERLGPEELERAADVHARLRASHPAPAFDGVYVTWDDLAHDPTDLDAAHHHDGGFHADGGFDANPVQWQTLRDHPVALRGPAAPEVWADADALRTWTLGNLESYWRPWVERQETLAGRGVMQMDDWAIVWGVLGIPRLYHTLVTGGVVSKTAAGAYARDTFGADWKLIVDEALRLRLGGEQSEEYRRRPLSRRRDALGFMNHVLDDAVGRGPDG